MIRITRIIYEYYKSFFLIYESVYYTEYYEFDVNFVLLLIETFIYKSTCSAYNFKLNLLAHLYSKFLEYLSVAK